MYGIAWDGMGLDGMGWDGTGWVLQGDGYTVGVLTRNTIRNM